MAKLLATVMLSCITLASTTIYNIYGSDNASAESVEFRVQAQSTLGVTIMDGSTNVGGSTSTMTITPTDAGAFSEKTLNINVVNNSGEGYTLAMTTASTNLTRTEALSNGSVPTIPTLSYQSGGYNPGTNGSTFPVNSWGYKVDSATNYLSVPSSVNLKRTTSASNGNNTTLKIGTKIDNSLPAGTYSTTLNFIAVSNYAAPVSGCPDNNICYNPNGADGASTMADQSVADGSGTMLFASNFSYSSHGFKGWCTGAGTNGVGSGTCFGPHQNITADEISAAITAQGGTISSNGLMLYAAWVTSSSTMQSFNCSSLSSGNVTGVTDTRDGNVYAVAKLADGKCWMIENLRLSNGAELTASNTNNPALPLTNAINQETGAILSSSNHLASSSSTWCTSQSANCYNRTMLNTDNTANASSANMTGNGGNTYSYGNYYNWYSATAGNGTYSNDTKNSNVSGSLCPANWHLPRGGSLTLGSSVTQGNASGNEFYALMKAIQTAKGATAEPNQVNPTYGRAFYDNATGATGNLRTYPNNFLFSGRWVGGSVNNRGSYGYYWSSTASNAAYAFDLFFGTSYVYPGTDDDSKYLGFAVRCVAGS